MGIMDKLSDIAAGPIGQTLGGYLTGEIEEARIEQQIQKEKDDRKAGLVIDTQKALIQENIKSIGKSNLKVDAAESLRQRGIPEYIIFEMDRQGFFNQDNPHNALASAQEMWGDNFWLDENNPYNKQFTQRSGQYEVPDIAQKYQSSADMYQNQIFDILNTDYGIGNNTASFLTKGQPEVKTTEVATATDTGVVKDQIPPLQFVQSGDPMLKVEEAQMRMATQNPEFLIALGFDIDREADFDADGNFNWAAFVSKSPKSERAVRLLSDMIGVPYSALAGGNTDKLGLGHMKTKHVIGDSVNELQLASTLGRVTSDVINAEKEYAQKELIIETIRNNNPEFQFEQTPMMIKRLDSANPNWFNQFKNLEFGEKNTVSSNPFAGTQLEYLIQEKNGVFTYGDNKLAAIEAEDYTSYADSRLEETLYNPRKPLTYFDIRDLHSKHYGTQATLTVESGLMVPPDPITQLGTGRATIGMGGPTAEDIQFSENYMVPSAVKFKKDKAGINYAPIQGMGEITSVLLYDTDMGTLPQIEDTLKEYVGDIEGLEAYITNLLLEQQNKGLLPNELSAMDLETLKDSVLDDITNYEYEVKEDKAEVGGSIDETIPETVSTVEQSIIPGEGPVDTEINPAFLELESKQQARKADLKEKTDKASKAVETAKDVIDALQEEADLSPDEATQLREEREKKVINWFKNIFKGE